MKKHIRKFLAFGCMISMLAATLPAHSIQALPRAIGYGSSSSGLLIYERLGLTIPIGTRHIVTALTSASNIKWKSSNKRVVALKKPSFNKIYAYGKKPGSSIVSAEVGGQRATVKIVVPPNSISLNTKNVSLYVGHTGKISANVVGKSKKVKWNSSNTKVAKVSASGSVSALKVGKSTITATANGKKATCKVEVKKLNKLNIVPYMGQDMSRAVSATNAIYNDETSSSGEDVEIHSQTTEENFYRSSAVLFGYRSYGTADPYILKLAYAKSTEFKTVEGPFQFDGVYIGMDISNVRNVLSFYGWKIERATRAKSIYTKGNLRLRVTHDMVMATNIVNEIAIQVAGTIDDF